MRSRSTVLVSAIAAIGLALAGCSVTVTDETVGTNGAGTVDFCDWFPQADLPPNPSPAPQPYGDPADVASFQKLAEDIKTTFGSSQRLAQYCASGQTSQTGPIDPAACNELYWGFQYANTPYSVQEMCNFWYLRADNSMWTTLTPKVLNEYGDYLGIESDGRNIPNLAAGPHVTIVSDGAVNAQFGSAATPFGTMAISNGQFDPVTLAKAAAPAFTATSGVTWNGGTSVLPLIAGDGMTVNCDNVYVAGNNNQVALSSLPLTTKQFWCTATSSSTQTNPTVGTAYVQVNVVSTTATNAAFNVTIPVLGPTDSILRKSGTSYDASNIVLPIGTSEVSGYQTTELSLPETCNNGTKVGSDQCLHIWVTKVKQGQSCTVWFVLEVDKTNITKTMQKYGLSTDGFTSHISLGNNEQKNNWTACQRAQTLNKSMGQAPTGNPPASFLAQTNDPNSPS